MVFLSSTSLSLFGWFSNKDANITRSVTHRIHIPSKSIGHMIEIHIGIDLEKLFGQSIL